MCKGSRFQPLAPASGCGEESNSSHPRLPDFTVKDWMRALRLLPTLARCCGFAGEKDLLVSDTAVSKGVWVWGEVLSWRSACSGTPVEPRSAQPFFVRSWPSSEGKRWWVQGLLQDCLSQGWASTQPHRLWSVLQALLLPRSPTTPHCATQPSLDKGTLITRVPSHLRPCLVLGTSHSAAPGDQRRSLGSLQVRLQGDGWPWAAAAQEWGCDSWY